MIFLVSTMKIRTLISPNVDLLPSTWAQARVSICTTFFGVNEGGSKCKHVARSCAVTMTIYYEYLGFDREHEQVVFVDDRRMRYLLGGGGEGMNRTGDLNVDSQVGTRILYTYLRKVYTVQLYIFSRRLVKTLMKP